MTRIHRTTLLGALLLCQAPSLSARADAPKAPAPPDAAAIAELKRRQELLMLENSIAEQQLRRDLAKLSAEKQRRELENSIAQQKTQAEIAALTAELDRLTRQTDVLTRRLALKEAERRARLDTELADAKEKLERARVGNDLATAQQAARTRELALREQELRVRNAELSTREQDLRIRNTDLQGQRAELDLRVARLSADIELREKRDQQRARVQQDIQYTKEPFRNGALTISDRRIALNGVITMRAADRVNERINYFNNLSRDYPIFIVIDSSPGGSVEAGYRILKTMSGSAAPIHVVIKSFAASMAATIATLASRSFAYPNAIILHHQLLAGAYGNLTERREDMKDKEEWWRRLAAPVAAKMGVGLEDFIKRMYQNRSTGDWREFADKARQLKWIDEVAETIHEQSYVRNPDAPPASPASPAPLRRAEAEELPEQLDAGSGRPFVRLPHLSPGDAYYLYDPDSYYRPSR